MRSRVTDSNANTRNALAVLAVVFGKPEERLRGRRFQRRDGGHSPGICFCSTAHHRIVSPRQLSYNPSKSKCHRQLIFSETLTDNPVTVERFRPPSSYFSSPVEFPACRLPVIRFGSRKSCGGRGIRNVESENRRTELMKIRENLIFVFQVR